MWIELDGKPLLGEGRMVMLQTIQRCGSLITASRETGIAYRKIRGAIRDMEQIVGRSLVKTYRGGEDGGGAVLTPEAVKLIASYKKLAAEFQQEAAGRELELNRFFLCANGENRHSVHGIRKSSMKPFNELLEESVARHGHLCAGQVIGVRMAMLGCRLIGVEEPKSLEWKKKILVFVEIDRCATDAIESVTGCRLGKRTLKFKDFGINAATFVNLETRAAYRIISTEESRDIARDYAPQETDQFRQQLKGYQLMPDELLFKVQRVAVDLPEWEMPGPPRRHAVCAECGQQVRDGREVYIVEKPVCRICAGESYFQFMEE